MDQDVKNSMLEITNTLGNIFNAEETEYLQVDLKWAIREANFTPEQIEAIQKAATESTFHDITGGEETFEEHVVHAFFDPANKAFNAIPRNIEDNAVSLRTLVNLKQALEDTVTNYSGRILPEEETPETVDYAVEQFKIIIKKLNPLIEAVSKEANIAPQEIERENRWEQINALPENFRELGNNN